MGDSKLMDKTGKRKNGRALDEIRPIKIEAHVLNRADGSAYLEWGNNKVLAAVYGPREVHPRHLQRTDRGIVRCRYNMAPFSVPDRKRPGPDRRSTEITKVASEVFQSVLFLKNFPRTTVDVFIEVLEADGGTRCAGITAASVALADAGIPMKDMVAACAVGKVDGKIVVDLDKSEDTDGEADIPIAFIPRTEEILLLQMDGNMSKDEMERAIDMSLKVCKEIQKIQKDALKNKYNSGSVEERTVEKEKEENGGGSDG